MARTKDFIRDTDNNYRPSRPLGNSRDISYGKPNPRHQRYLEGFHQGGLDKEYHLNEKYYFNTGLTYREIWDLIKAKGKITFRHNSYPMVMIPLSLLTDEFYHIRPLGLKLRWDRIMDWNKGHAVLLVWQGPRAQALIRAVKIYVERDDAKMMAKVHRVLRWLPGEKQQVDIDTPNNSFDATLAVQI